MIITHVDYYTFPNTPGGRVAAEQWESILHRMGHKAAIKTTTTGITVGYEETIELKPHGFEVMREPKDEGVE